MADEPPISFNRQLGALDVGGTVATARRSTRDSLDIPAIKAKLRSSINPAVSKARKKHESEYRTDTGEFLTDDGHVIVVCAVTRLS